MCLSVPIVLNTESWGSTAHDLTSSMGLVAAVVCILGMRCGALCHLATVCTSFTCVNSGTHKRSISFPLGWRWDLNYIQLGNVLAARSAVLALLTWGWGGFPTLEQPLRSLMTALPSWQSVIGYFDEAESKGWTGQRLKLNKISMAAFRASSLKPTGLYSTEAFDDLINMWVPPKNQRPPQKDAVTVSYPGFILRWFCFHVWGDFISPISMLPLVLQLFDRGIAIPLAQKGSREDLVWKLRNFTRQNLGVLWQRGGWHMVQSPPGPICHNMFAMLFRFKVAKHWTLMFES